MVGPGARRRGVDVIPERVRTARQEAGLSLAQLAAGAVTPVAIHLVETGKSRPSAGTLLHIANRTGKPVHYFTDLEPSLVSGSIAGSASQARRSMQEASWALTLTLRHPKLTRTEREALRSIIGNLRWSAGLVELIRAELSQR
jgi:transcriptional regulator with XRE-family HTH domain